MLHVASKLNYKNLNEELLKHFARLQAKDDQVRAELPSFLMCQQPYLRNQNFELFNDKKRKPVPAAFRPHRMNLVGTDIF